jgi:pyruvate formate lyase activating enzyme
MSPLPEKVISTRRIGEREFSGEEVAGINYRTDEIIRILEGERVFFNYSGGGVTFSGGEPMLQTEFLLETLTECKNQGFHTAVDTSGYSSAENYKAIIPYTDLFLFDIKHLDEQKHIAFTGVSNVCILENFRLLIGSGKKIMIRIPVIPGFNDDQIYFGQLRDFLASLETESLNRISLLPYHRTGLSKYRRLNIRNRMEGVEPPSKGKMEKLRKFLSESGYKVKIGG